MFDRLTDTFNGLFRKLSGQSTISEKNVADAMDEVRTALLEADVHYQVVNDFCEKVRQDAIGREVTKSLKPAQEMVGIVHERLVELLGGRPMHMPKAIAESGELAVASSVYAAGEEEPPIPRISPGPTIVMMCGLQGSGKTTTCGKLAAYLKKRGRSVMLAAADLQRPAAVEQLHTVAEQVNNDLPGGAQVHFYAEPDKVAAYGKAVGVAVGVCQRALAAAQKQGVDTLILDTAGRLHINDELMGELEQVRRFVQPHQVYLVVDAMTGQDAVNSARAFHEKLEIDGVILTKYDSDTRGGAALSVKQITGAPIKFVGVGEKLDALEEFHAQRVAGRILGMGDVVSLVEKAQEQVSFEDAEKLQQKMAKGEMTMDDFLSQMRTLRKMGPLKQLLGLLPGVGSMMKQVNIDDKQLDRLEAIVCSMTRAERRTPSIIDTPRRRRIAAGSGTQQNDVTQLVKQFETVNKLSRQMASMTASGKMKAMKELGSGAPDPSFNPFAARGSTHTASVKDRFKKRKR